MAKGTCSVDGCDRTASSRTWCHGHYNRWRRNGNLGSAPIQSRRTGCLVEDCQEPHFGNGYCQVHNYRLKVNGDPLVTRSTAPPVGDMNPGWRGDDVRYSAVHRRLRKYRGRANEFPCSSCSSQAETWAYQHDADNERICEKSGLPYSTDLSHYEPMCRSCHAQLDALHGWTTPDHHTAGVSHIKQSGRWRAYAVLDGVQHNAKTHGTREEAEQAAIALRARLLEDWQKAKP